MTDDGISYVSHNEHNYDHNSSANGEGGNESEAALSRMSFSPLLELGSPSENSLDNITNHILNSASPTPVPSLAANSPSTRGSLEAMSLLPSRENVEPEGPTSDRHTVTRKSWFQHLRKIEQQEKATENTLKRKCEDPYVTIQDVNQALFRDEPCTSESDEALEAAMYQELDWLWKRRKIACTNLFKHQEKTSKANTDLVEYLSR